jgi:hypothetical protein
MGQGPLARIWDELNKIKDNNKGWGRKKSARSFEDGQNIDCTDNKDHVVVNKQSKKK